MSNVPTEEQNKFYKNEPIHRMFIGEVVNIIDKIILLKIKVHFKEKSI